VNVARTRVAALSLCLLLAGCAAFAQKSDYFDYRAVRLEHRDDARLLAMQHYVARHPSGRWYDEVQRERRIRDRQVFEAGKGQRAGIELYLAAFPDGVFAGQAKARLSAIGVIEQRKQQEAQRAERLSEERKRQEAELSRTWVTRFFGYWTKTLLGLGNWGAPIDQVARANAEFSRAFGRPPRPRCTADECIKYYESAYAVPIPGGTRLERSMRLILRLHMDKGQLVRAELLLPALGFSRWQEIEERRPVVDGDPEARAQAVQWVMARVSSALDALAPDRQALEGVGLPEISKPGIAASGELVDTTAEDPGAPANRIQGEAAPGPEPTVEQLVKPTAPEQAADLEMAPLQVGLDGRARPGPETAPATPAAPQPAGGLQAPEMEMAPLAVPLAGAPTTPGGTSPSEEAAAAPAMVAAPAAPASPAMAHAFRVGKLRIVIFAAASDAVAPAFDGLLIEPAPNEAPLPGRAKARAPKRAASGAAGAAAVPGAPSAPGH
jgi:hypothetical protein